MTTLDVPSKLQYEIQQTITSFSPKFPFYFIQRTPSFFICWIFFFARLTRTVCIYNFSLWFVYLCMVCYVKYINDIPNILVKKFNFTFSLLSGMVFDYVLTSHNVKLKCRNVSTELRTINEKATRTLFQIQCYSILQENAKTVLKKTSAPLGTIRTSTSWPLGKSIETGSVNKMEYKLTMLQAQYPKTVNMAF